MTSATTEITSTHGMASDLLRRHTKKPCLTPGELRWVQSIANTMHPAMHEHDLVCVIHTRAEMGTTGKKPPKGAAAQFASLAADVGVLLT